MTFTRIFFTATALAFMAIGVMGIYLLLGWAAQLIWPHLSYWGMQAVERNGMSYPILCIVMGLTARRLWSAHLNGDRDSLAGRIVTVAKQSW